MSTYHGPKCVVNAGRREAGWPRSGNAPLKEGANANCNALLTAAHLSPCPDMGSPTSNAAGWGGWLPSGHVERHAT